MARWIAIKSGVPHLESVLGPLLFCYNFVNDILLNNDSPIEQFADDTKLYRVIKCSEKEKDLGVWISSDLKPPFRCQQIAAKAMQTLGRIKLSFKFLSCSSFKIFVPYLYSPSVKILCSSLVSILD